MTSFGKIFIGFLVTLLINTYFANAVWYERNEEQGKVIERTHFKTINSTQLHLREEADKLVSGERRMSSNRWNLVTADEQTAGIGQQNRMWASPPNVNVYATYLIPWPSSKMALQMNIPQTVTVAMAQLLEEIGFKPQIKWINDTYLDEKKVCGVLCETKGLIKGTSENVLLIGIGFNVNMSKDICETLDQPVTSLKVQSGKDWDKDLILEKMNKYLLLNLRKLIHGEFDAIYPDLKKRLIYVGLPLTVNDDGQNYEGICQGIDKKGGLLLKMQNGEEKVFYTGRIVKKPEQKK